MLRAQGVHYAFSGSQSPALAGVDLELSAASFTALLGPNGSGKSTLLRALAGILRPSAGEVTLSGPEGDLCPHRVSRLQLARRMVFLPARPQVPPDYTSLEVVLMARHPFGRGSLLEQDGDLRLAEAALERTGAGPFRQRPCHELSSGERQRVLLARALCQGVPVLLLDEPTSAQDPAHALDLFQLFAQLAAEEGRTVVVATHDLNAAARHAHQLAVMVAGRTVRAGPPAEVLEADMLREVFSVEAILGEDDGLPFVVPRRRA